MERCVHSTARVKKSMQIYARHNVWLERKKHLATALFEPVPVALEGASIPTRYKTCSYNRYLGVAPDIW